MEHLSAEEVPLVVSRQAKSHNFPILPMYHSPIFRIYHHADDLVHFHRQALHELAIQLHKMPAEQQVRVRVRFRVRFSSLFFPFVFLTDAALAHCYLSMSHRVLKKNRKADRARSLLPREDALARRLI